MSRKKKIVLCAVLGLVILLTAGLIWGGNYLVTFAIARSTGLQDIVPESTLSDETTQAIIRTWEQQAQQAKDWMAQSAVETVQVQSADGLKLSGEAVVTDPPPIFGSSTYTATAWIMPPCPSSTPIMD